MRFGYRRPSLKKRISARTSVKRMVRHNLGFKVPRGMGFLTNPKKALYNSIYHRTTFGLSSSSRRYKQSTDLSNESASEILEGLGQLTLLAFGAVFLIVCLVINPALTIFVGLTLSILNRVKCKEKNKNSNSELDALDAPSGTYYEGLETAFKRLSILTSDPDFEVKAAGYRYSIQVWRALYGTRVVIPAELQIQAIDTILSNEQFKKFVLFWCSQTFEDDDELQESIYRNYDCCKAMMDIF